MPKKKQLNKQEPLLNTVARKLGQVAGTLTKATHGLTENLSAIPETVTTKLREAADVVPAGHAHSRTRHNRKKIRIAGASRTSKVALAVKSRRSSNDKSPRNGPKVSNRKK
jgi:hypothetical protein